MNKAVLKIVPKEKICSLCKISKPYSEYHKNKDRGIGIQPRCKECRNRKYKDPRKNRRDRLPAKYGITYEDVKLAYANQLGLCANRGCGCNITLVGPTSKNKAVIDHCHKTGKFRALLCNGCNLLLGKILGLMEYEEKYKNIF